MRKEESGEQQLVGHHPTNGERVPKMIEDIRLECEDQTLMETLKEHRRITMVKGACAPCQPGLVRVIMHILSVDSSNPVSLPTVILAYRSFPSFKPYIKHITPIRHRFETFFSLLLNKQAFF
ncbi:hypothetical protein VNO77_16781 [Canavalia gladiata]|uniref:Uncharacterized protein n=1 Tax=Canavalia gladiata TaxID=3824 RepID=A0AAN9QFY3_CANGL